MSYPTFHIELDRAAGSWHNSQNASLSRSTGTVHLHQKFRLDDASTRFIVVCFALCQQESISSINTTAGSLNAATANMVRTNFSPSPIHLLVNEELDMEKKVEPLSWAMALPIKVFRKK
mmetsp:Transcript_10779/g.14280  ORF Transcript_10779/g.14280 Transcript_10779/m.14280 type:complete len:119 (-) Transcript_10779:8-364(-)